MKLFAIFGDPVAHSRSPLMHNSVFKHLNYKACYTRVHLTDGSKFRETFFALGLSGANVTVPHKEAAYAACDEVRGFAKKVGVVNTIVLEGNRLIGYNTDADGFMFAIEEFGALKRVLMLGAGGTAKALSARLKESGVEVSILNRSKERLAYFEALGCECFSWDDFKLKKYDLVVNTTSAGLKDDELPAPLKLIEAILENTSFVADVIYGKKTPFLQHAQNKNIPSKDGAAMLLAQGILANELLVHHELKTQDIKKYMSKSFAI